MKEMHIPWAVPYIGKEELDEVVDTIESTWVTMGPKVKRLESLIAGYLGVKNCIAVSSGTAALDVALKMIDVQPGDEVIIPAMTYIATANAVLYQHAKPVLADIDPETYTIDPEDVSKKITNKTKTPTVNNIVPDNWIYIQERDVKLGRLQIFNNWSPYMVKNPA